LWLRVQESIKLHELLEHYPYWYHLKSLVDNDATFSLTPISPEDRVMDNNFHKEHGNHKSVVKNSETFDKVTTEDITRGSALPLPMMILHLIPNASLAPLGC
jgi:hypothetical protein